MPSERVKSITRIYYSNPAVQKAIFDFSQQREVVPRYMEGFGKRPDTLQYQSDIMALVNKGATSFHCSEEIWIDPLTITSESDLHEQRKAWDLLIDIDSPYLDYSKIAAKLIINALEKHGIKNYGIKFSGSKGFHILVPSKAFPELFDGQQTKNNFPEWPRAISEYLMFLIRKEYNKSVVAQDINFNAVKERTNLTKEDLVTLSCPRCGTEARKTTSVSLRCPICNNTNDRPDVKLTNKKLRCITARCPGFYDIVSQKEEFFCDKCKLKSFNPVSTAGNWKNSKNARASMENVSSEFSEEVSAEKLASLDLVLVSSRHLFRAPYSLHEKTSLASLPITREEIEKFEPQMANPMKVKIMPYYPNSISGEAELLLRKALEWKRTFQLPEVKREKVEYNIDTTGITEEEFPNSIKKLMLGLKDGKKRGLFVMITFLRCLNFPDGYIEDKVTEWNKKNQPPLRDGYVKAQLDWHFKQKKKILPPNYANQSFYKDLQLIDKMPNAKNPLAEAMSNLRKKR